MTLKEMKKLLKEDRQNKIKLALIVGLGSTNSIDVWISRKRLPDRIQNYLNINDVRRMVSKI